MMDENQAQDLYEREEQALKAIKTVRKAIVMRIVVAALMVWAVVMPPNQPIVWGLMVFVLMVDVLGALPLLQEWKRQKRKLADLIAQEEP